MDSESMHVAMADMEKHKLVSSSCLKRNAVVEVRQQVAALDKEITSLTQAICHLELKKSLHTLEIKRCKGILTLARRIPCELLAYIFTLCVVEFGWTNCPFVVSQVCSEWRLASRVPSCWSHMYINLDSPSAYHQTTFWLQKASSGPLYLTLEVQHTSSEDLIFVHILSSLAAHATRWKILNIASYDIPQTNAIILHSTMTTPKSELTLVSVEIQQTTQPNADDGDRPLELWRLTQDDKGNPTAPKLKKLFLTKDTLPASPISLPRSLLELTLTIPSSLSDISRPIPIQKVLQILEHLEPTLERLTIELPFGHHRQFIVSDQVPLPLPPLPLLQSSIARVTSTSLSSLTLIGSSSMFNTLAYLDTPNLVELNLKSSLSSPLIAGNGNGSGSLSESLVNFSDHSPHLQTIRIRDIDISEESLIRCLSRWKFLQDVGIHDCEVGDDFIDALSQWSQNLKTLDLRWCGVVTGGAISGLVKHRQTSHQPIHCVTVINCAEVREKDVFDIAKGALCRLTVPTGVQDDCQTRKCCVNHRYTKRFRAKWRITFGGGVCWNNIIL